MSELGGRVLRLFSVVLDAIVPPRERTARTNARTQDHIPLHPQSHRLLGSTITTVMDYRDPVVQDLIRSLKYDGNAHAAHLSAEVLADYLREEIIQARAYSPRPILLLPMPLYTKRLRERGFNQIDIVLQRLPKEFRNGELARVETHALIRTRATVQQTHLHRSQRLKNVAGAFSIIDPKRIQDTHVFLIDDVTTTGATLVSGGKPLEKSGARITLIALARA
jgi:ComF family protein